MKILLIIVGLLLALAALALLGLVFFIGGGFERWGAERAVAARGYTASELHDVDGLWRMKLPRGWLRDDYSETIARAVRFGPDAVPGSSHRLSHPDYAEARFALGRYAHIGGSVTSALLEVYVPTPNAPAWKVNVGQSDYAPTWREHRREKDRVWYVLANATAEDFARGVRLIFHDERSGVRVDLRTSADVYALDQAEPMVAEIAASIEVDARAMRLVVAEYHARADQEHQLASQARQWLLEHFALSALTEDWGQVAITADGSYVQSNGESVQVLYRLGEVPAPGGASEALVKAWHIDPARISPAMRDNDRPTATGAQQLKVIGLWREGDGGLGFADLQDPQQRGYFDPSVPLAQAVLGQLPADAMLLCRLDSFAWTQPDELARWLRASAAIRDVAARGQPIWIATN